MGQIGVPTEYEAWIVDSLTQQTLVKLPWATLEWQRVLNATSSASATVPRDRGGPSSCETIGGLSAWQHMLVIERDGERVWDGPIVGWSAGADLNIHALDRSAMLTKRLLAADLTASHNPIWTNIIDVMLTEAGWYTSGVGQMPYSCTASWAYQSENLGEEPLVTGKWRVTTLSTLASVFDDLVGSVPVNWTQRMTNTIFFNEYRDARHDNDASWLILNESSQENFPVLSANTIISPSGELNVTVVGNDLVTGVYKGTTGTGIAGFPNYAIGGTYNSYITSALYGVVTDAELGEIYVDDVNGAPINYNQFPSPYPKTTIEQIQLAPSFGNDTMANGVNYLVPGAIWNVDFPDSCNMNIPVIRVMWYWPDGLGGYNVAVEPSIKHCRLEELNVTVTMTEQGLSEQIQAGVSAFALNTFYDTLP